MKYRNLSLIILLFSFLLMFTKACAPEETEVATPSPPEWSYNATIYEVNVRQFSEDGSFKAVEEALPRLRDMGVKIIWLMPIHPIGEVERKGTMGSYYSVKDFFDVNPEFGTKDDFRSLVEATHAHDMKIILDWVANHTAWDNSLTETNPEFFETNEDGNFMPPRGTDWSDVIQLDYENPEVWDYMISALSYWVEEFNIDGYRCDVAYMVPTEFWNRARQELDSIKPVFMLAEAESPELHPAFDMSYTWRLHHAMNAIAQGEEPVSRIDEIIAEYRAEFPANAFLMTFTSNHDENSWAGTVFERLGDGAKAFGVLSATMDGMPLVYNGQEVGLNKRLEFFEKDPIIWDFDSPFLDFYTRLLNLNLTNPVLRNGDRGAPMVRIETSAQESVYAFVRDDGINSVFVMLNLTGEPVTFTSTQIPGGEFTNLFTDEIENPALATEYTLAPWDYVVLHR